MTSFLENMRRWRIAAGETHALLDQNSELLTRRFRLLQRATHEFRHVVSLARKFTDGARGGQEPAARSTSARRR